LVDPKEGYRHPDEKKAEEQTSSHERILGER
jgi:hypothetical protein